MMAYVGDVLLKGKRLQDVEEVFIALVVKTNKTELKIKEKKDKICYRITKALQCE